MKKRILSNGCAALGGALAMALLLAALAWVRLGGAGLRSAAKYASVLAMVEENYIGGDYEAEAFTDAALAGGVASLDDDWSYYMDAETYAAYLDYSANRYQGIGVTVQKDEQTGGFLLLDIEADGPADRAGVRAGEIVIAIDGEDLRGGEVADLKARIQAAYGGSVRLTLLGADGAEREVEVSCEVVQTVPVSSQLLEGNGYIRIENFELGAAEAAIAAVENLREQGAESLIFDVRQNPGGRVTELCELLDYLLPEGDIFIRADRKGRETVERSDADCVPLPMAVLLDGGSYSAAEFFAATLREYEWAQLVGVASSGKGRSQVTLPLFDGSALHISRYVYLTPQRRDLAAEGGLQPDVTAELSAEQQELLAAGQLSPQDDAQLQAAQELLAQ